MQKLEPRLAIPTDPELQEAEYLRCICGKIVSQTDDHKVIIKCRHCKKFIVIHTKGITKIEYR